MKNTSTVSYVLRLALTLLLICAVVAAVLAGVNAITKDKIAAINAQKTTDAIAAVLPDAGSATALETYQDPSGLVTAVYESETGYAIEVAPSGFGGTVSMMVGVDRAGQVLGVRVISHSETAGLGAVAAASTAKGQSFREQFIGTSGILAVSKDGGSIDSISGATITSRAVTEGVNAAIACAAAQH